MILGPVAALRDPRVLAQLLAHAKAEWPREACGFVLRQDERVRVMLCANVQDRLHASDPTRWPRTAEHGYTVSPEALVVLGLALRRGAQLLAIYHSHTAAWGANFSDEDRAGALAGRDAPQFPNALQVVVSIRPTGDALVGCYRWDGVAYVEAAKKVDIRVEPLAESTA